MAEKTGIQWTKKTWNPTVGCSFAGNDCINCYAILEAARQCGPGQKYEGVVVKGPDGVWRWTGTLKLWEPDLNLPLSWRNPARIFVNSMSDLFHKKVKDEWIDRIFDVMAAAPQHVFQALTKRPWRAREYLSAPGRRVLPNVHVGVSVGRQKYAEKRIPPLLETPASVRWVSYEPALEAVDFSPWISKLDWIVIGGESGKRARPFDVEWARKVIAQCREAGKPVFMKQVGCCAFIDGWPVPVRHGHGGDPEEWPADLRVREYPR